METIKTIKILEIIDSEKLIKLEIQNLPFKYNGQNEE